MFSLSPRFPMNLAPNSNALDAAKTLQGALSTAKSLPVGWIAKAALWAIERLLSGAASEDDVRDLVEATDGIIGFAKRRFSEGSPERSALAIADSYLDDAHESLGEAQS
jgi:2-methylcitrate dehydratase PrpD